MKNIKWLIITGGTLLLIGIILKVIGIEGIITTLCFSTGGSLKLIYLILGIKSGRLKLGYEIVFLVLGLTFIFGALGIKQNTDWHQYYVASLVTGIIMKSLFVILFIRRQKINSQISNQRMN